MPTQAEAARQAQEDAMARQAMLQAAAQRQANAVRGDALGARNEAARAQIDIANIQADAQRDAAYIMADRESANNDALMKRQLAVTEAGKGMSEAQREDLAMRKMSPEYLVAQRLAAKLGGEANRGGAVVAPPKNPVAADVAGPKPQATPYDMTGFNSDVAGIAENVRVAKNQSDGQLSYDDLPAYQPGMQGAFVRDPTGVNRQVHFPSASSSKTPDRSSIERLKASMMPKPPAGLTVVQPPVASGASDAQPAPAPVAPSPMDYVESPDDELARLTGKPVSVKGRIGEARAITSAQDVEAAAKALREGNYTGAAGRKKLEGIITNAGGVVPAFVAAGQTAGVEALASDPDFIKSVDEARAAAASVSGPSGMEGNTGGESIGAMISRMVRQRATAIAERTGVPATTVAKEIANQATAGQRGVDNGFFSGIGNAFNEAVSLGYAETPREAMLKKLMDDFALEAYRQQQAARK